MKHLCKSLTERHWACLLLAVSIFSCTPTQYQAQNNGAIFTNGPLATGNSAHWSGGVDENGFASGQGVVTFRDAGGVKYKELKGSFVAGAVTGKYAVTEYRAGRVSFRGTATAPSGEYESHFPQSRTPDELVYSKGFYDANGYVHGKRKRIWYGGKSEVAHYSHGDYVSSIVYNPDGSIKYDSAQQAAQSGPDDNTNAIIGGLFALGGAYAGDSNVASAGISMMGGTHLVPSNSFRAGTWLRATLPPLVLLPALAMPIPLRLANQT